MTLPHPVARAGRVVVLTALVRDTAIQQFVTRLGRSMAMRTSRADTTKS